MTLDELKGIARGTELVWERTGERISFIAPHAEPLGRGACATRAYVKFADGREGTVPASEVRDPENPGLSPTQAEFLLWCYVNNAGVAWPLRGARPATADRLIKLGLLSRGGSGVDGVYGGRLTSLGERVAARLIEKGK